MLRTIEGECRFALTTLLWRGTRALRRRLCAVRAARIAKSRKSAARA